MHKRPVSCLNLASKPPAEIGRKAVFEGRGGGGVGLQRAGLENQNERYPEGPGDDNSSGGPFHSAFIRKKYAFLVFAKYALYLPLLNPFPGPWCLRENSLV